MSYNFVLSVKTKFEVDSQWIKHSVTYEHNKFKITLSGEKENRKINILTTQYKNENVYLCSKVN